MAEEKEVTGYPEPQQKSGGKVEQTKDKGIKGKWLSQGNSLKESADQLRSASEGIHERTHSLSQISAELRGDVRTDDPILENLSALLNVIKDLDDIKDSQLIHTYELTSFDREIVARKEELLARSKELEHYIKTLDSTCTEIDDVNMETADCVVKINICSNELKKVARQLATAYLEMIQSRKVI